MARKRFITSDISVDERIAQIAQDNPIAALMWPWFITGFDDWGRMEASPTKIKLSIFQAFPYTVQDIQDAIGLYGAVGLVHLYQVNNKQYMAIEPEKFYRYQTYLSTKRKAECKSNYPEPVDAPWCREKQLPSIPCNNQQQSATVADIHNNQQQSAIIALSPSLSLSTSLLRKEGDAEPPASPSSEQTQQNNSPKRERTSRKDSNPDVKVFLDYYHDTFLSQFGERPVVDWGKDGAIVKCLLSTYGLEKLKGLLDDFFKVEDDDLVRKNGYTLGMFKAKINGLIAGAKKPEKTRSRMYDDLSAKIASLGAN